MAALSSQAQSDFPLQFVDENGQIITDGMELDIIDYEEFISEIQPKHC